MTETSPIKMGEVLRLAAFPTVVVDAASGWFVADCLDYHVIARAIARGNLLIRRTDNECAKDKHRTPCPPH